MSKQVIFNGLNLDGNPVIPTMSLKKIYDIALQKEATIPKKEIAFYKKISRFLKQPVFLGWPEIDFNDLTQARWGIIYPESVDTKIVNALQPLVQHRAAQIGCGPDDLVFSYKSGENGEAWLRRHGIEPTEPAPEKTPYYLLIIAEPDVIPYSFQFSLVQHAVGRLALSSADNYRSYVENILHYEEEMPKKRRKWVFCGPNHDDFTVQAHAWLEKVLSNNKWGERSQMFERLMEHEATKENLVKRLEDADTERELLFFAGHGLHCFPALEEEQRLWQGAFCCQPHDDQDNILYANDITQTWNVHNHVIVTTACHGAGTPEVSDFAHWWKFLLSPETLEGHTAWISQVSSLPKRLLSHERPVLAFIGHIDVFTSLSLSPELFYKILNELWQGTRIGHTLRHFRERATNKSFHIAERIDTKQKHGLRPQVESFATDWVIRNDARNFTILGDPAVRLHVENEK